MRFVKRAARVTPRAARALELGACSDFLDVNKNPNAPESGDRRHPVAGARDEVHSLDVLRRGRAVGLASGRSSGHSTRAGVRTRRCRTTSCTIRTPRRPGTISIRGRATPRSRWHAMRRRNRTCITSGIAKLFHAWTFQLITDLWGPAPYTEAFKPEIREPKYESQQTIYNGIFANLDTAVTLLSSHERAGAQADDERPAVRRRHHEVDEAGALPPGAAHLRLAYASGEDKVAPREQSAHRSRRRVREQRRRRRFHIPRRRQRAKPELHVRRSANVFVASQYMIEMLKNRNDPRLPILFTPIVYDSIRGTGTARRTFPAKPNTFVGHLAGSDQSQADSTVSHDRTVLLERERAAERRQLLRSEVHRGGGTA